MPCLCCARHVYGLDFPANHEFEIDNKSCECAYCQDCLEHFRNLSLHNCPRCGFYWRYWLSTYRLSHEEVEDEESNNDEDDEKE